MKGKKSNIVIYILLVILAVIFLAPIFIILFIAGNKNIADIIVGNNTFLSDCIISP